MYFSLNSQAGQKAGLGKITDVQVRANVIIPGMWLLHETSLTSPNSTLVLKAPPPTHLR